MTMITDTQLAAMRLALDALEAKPKTRFSTPEAVDALARQIRRARDELGHDLTDIALLLQAHGLAIKPTTLRGYLRKLATAEPAPKTRKSQSAAARKAPAGAAGPAMAAGAALQARDAAPEDDLVPELADGQGG